jgi:8-oxo-(d)GTP phosphatase
MASEPPPASKLIRAAGAVVSRSAPDGAGRQVLLVHRLKYDDWSLPKGKQEPGEQLPLTAVREVFEEAGARMVLGRRLASVRYQVSGRPKRVHYWSALVAGTDGDAVPNSEVDEIAWLTLAQARQRASYGRDLNVLDDFARLPADTVPLILARHARAVHKSDWTRQDADRPLDDGGQADAEALARLLVAFAPAARVISSPAVRCMQTIRPYTQLSGAQGQAENSLDISGTDRAVSAALVEGAVAAGEPAVFCAHRENLPLLLAAALGALGASGVPEGFDDPLPTAAFWVLHTAGRRLVAAEVYDLSAPLAAVLFSAAGARRRRRRRTTIQTAATTTSAIST